MKTMKNMQRKKVRNDSRSIQKTIHFLDKLALPILFWQNSK